MPNPTTRPELPPIPHGELYSQREHADLIEWAMQIADAARADGRRKALEEVSDLLNQARADAGDINSRIALSQIAKKLDRLIDRKEPTT